MAGQAFVQDSYTVSTCKNVNAVFAIYAIFMFHVQPNEVCNNLCMYVYIYIYTHTLCLSVYIYIDIYIEREIIGEWWDEMMLF